jgi:cytochrome c556
MRWIYFIILQAIILLVIGGVVYKHQNKVSLIKTPPAELAQWYKPENKRQAWLQNMFKLRREMQAVAFYAAQKDNQHVAKWVGQLGQHYSKIADMVPTWQNKLDMQAMLGLANASESKNFTEINSHLLKLQQSCDNCHSDYQAITALTYRSPDFSSIEVSDELPFNEHMDILTQQVNQIKISAEDGFTKEALSSLSKLDLNMEALGGTCVNCHKKDRKIYPSELMTKTMHSLKTALISGTQKEQGRELGTLAVLACARCHGTHKIAYSAKKQLIKSVNFSELLKH